MATQLTNLAKSLNILAAGTSSSTNTSQSQVLQTQLDFITQKLDKLSNQSPKTETVTAYSATENQELREVKKMVQELSEAMKTLDRRVDARINGIAQRERDSRVNPQRTRDGRPICFNCGTTGHVQSACPQRRVREQRPVPRNALPPPPNVERDRYQPRFQPRRQAFGPRGYQYNPEYQPRQREIMSRDHRDSRTVTLDYHDAERPCMGSYRYVNKVVPGRDEVEVETKNQQMHEAEKFTQR